MIILYRKIQKKNNNNKPAIVTQIIKNIGTLDNRVRYK